MFAVARNARKHGHSPRNPILHFTRAHYGSGPRFLLEYRKTAEREKEENFGETTLGRLRKTLWDLFEYPASSRWAKVGRTSHSQISIPSAAHVIY